MRHIRKVKLSPIAANFTLIWLFSRIQTKRSSYQMCWIAGAAGGALFKHIHFQSKLPKENL